MNCKENAFLSDGDVVILNDNIHNENVYTIYGLGREENVSFPHIASYKLVEINLKLMPDNSGNIPLKFLCYLNNTYNINIDNFINKNLKSELKNINIQKLKKIGKIQGKFNTRCDNLII